MHMLQNFYYKEKPMSTIPDLGQANETCDGVKQVKWDPNPPNKWSKAKINENKRDRKYTIVLDNVNVVYWLSD